MGSGAFDFRTMNTNLTRSNRGFSLIELLAALILIALIGRSACRLFEASVDNSSHIVAMESFDAVRLALGEYMRRNPRPRQPQILGLRRGDTGALELSASGDHGPRIHIHPESGAVGLKCFYEIGGEMVPFMLYWK